MSIKTPISTIFKTVITIVSKYKIDVLSIILSAIGFGGIVFGFSYAGDEGCSSPIVLASLGIGVLALVIYILRQLTIEDPVIHLKVFKHPMFILAVVITLFGNIIGFSAHILLPLFMQGGLGLSASAAGLLLLPGGMINEIMSMVRRIFDKYGPGVLVIGGFVISTIACIFFANVSLMTDAYLTIFFFMLLMVSLSMVLVPSQTNGLNQLEPDLYPDGTAVINSMIQTSGVIGTALAISILNISQHAFLSDISDSYNAVNKAEALITGVQNAFTFSSIISIIDLVCSLFIKRAKAGIE
ncbi:hypothetical protein [Salinicoccus bachuensis]|uniref:MFS transporter n=1 Tax=Salinicoccus bachuensis TaxID=3136731 RepID=A0ABZ3CFU4_9STAP